VKRGDVILFQAPRRPEMTYVKRAIGLPGDKLEIQNGVLYVNGQEMKKSEYPDRSVLYDIERSPDKRLYVEDLTGRNHFVILDSMLDGNPSRNLEPITVPEGHLFAVGDNRDNSYDSRAWGFVPVENLKGKAMFIWFSGWDPLLKENMVKEHSIPMQIFYFVVDFFRFIGDWIQGQAWIRYEKIGTLIQ
jgi:signal peptidase I